MSELPKISVADVVEAVAAQFGMTPAALMSSRKDGVIARARHVACWLAGRLTFQSNVAVGRVLRIDHATVIRGRRETEERRQSEPAFAELLVGLEAAALAIAQLRERRIAPPPRHIDPFEVAHRIVAERDHAAARVSIAEIVAVCETLDALTADRDDYLDRESFRAAVQATLTAHRELQAALYTTSERSARERLERALNELSNHSPTRHVEAQHV